MGYNTHRSINGRTIFRGPPLHRGDHRRYTFKGCSQATTQVALWNHTGTRTDDKNTYRSDSPTSFRCRKDILLFGYTIIMQTY